MELYYHGTGKTSAAKGIIKSGGLDPAATDVKYDGRQNTALRPAQNKVYITPDLRYAIVYAIGGDMLGSDYYDRRPPKEGEEYGFIFTFNADKVDQELMYPDEDGIGEILHKFYMRDWESQTYKMDMRNEAWFQAFVELAYKKLTGPQQNALKDKYVDYGWYAKAGKKLMPFLTQEMRVGLIKMGAHIAHEGALKYLKVYSFDKKLTKKLEKDGSNFFKLAKIVRKGSPILGEALMTFKEFVML